MDITYVNEITLTSNFKSGIDYNDDKSSDGMDMTCNLTSNLNFLDETGTSVESAQLQNCVVKHQEKLDLTANLNDTEFFNMFTATEPLVKNAKSDVQSTVTKNKTLMEKKHDDMDASLTLKACHDINDTVDNDKKISLNLDASQRVKVSKKQQDTNKSLSELAEKVSPAKCIDQPNNNSESFAATKKAKSNDELKPKGCLNQDDLDKTDVNNVSKSSTVRRSSRSSKKKESVPIAVKSSHSRSLEKTVEDLDRSNLTDFKTTTSRKTMDFTCAPAANTTISNNLTDFKTTTSRKTMDFTCLPTTTTEAKHQKNEDDVEVVLTIDESLNTVKSRPVTNSASDNSNDNLLKVDVVQATVVNKKHKKQIKNMNISSQAVKDQDSNLDKTNLSNASKSSRVLRSSLSSGKKDKSYKKKPKKSPKLLEKTVVEANKSCNSTSNKTSLSGKTMDFTCYPSTSAMEVDKPKLDQNAETELNFLEDVVGVLSEEKSISDNYNDNGFKNCTSENPENNDSANTVVPAVSSKLHSPAVNSSAINASDKVLLAKKSSQGKSVSKSLNLKDEEKMSTESSLNKSNASRGENLENSQVRAQSEANFEQTCIKNTRNISLKAESINKTQEPDRSLNIKSNTTTPVVEKSQSEDNLNQKSLTEKAEVNTSKDKSFQHTDKEKSAFMMSSTMMPVNEATVSMEQSLNISEIVAPTSKENTLTNSKLLVNNSMDCSAENRTLEPSSNNSKQLIVEAEKSVKLEPQNNVKSMECSAENKTLEFKPSSDNEQHSVDEENQTKLESQNSAKLQTENLESVESGSQKSIRAVNCPEASICKNQGQQSMVSRFVESLYLNSFKSFYVYNTLLQVTKTNLCTLGGTLVKIFLYQV